MARSKQRIWHRFQASLGGALIIVTLSLIVLIGAMGMAFDSFLATTSRTQYQGIADRLALAALESYSQQFSISGDPVQAVDKAVTRSKELLGLNVNLLITKGYFKSPDSQQDLQANLSGSSSGTNGFIQPGRWYDEDAPCSANPSAFCPLTQAELTSGTVPNAFHVQVGVSTASPIKTIFMKFLGHESYTTRASATAALTPRRAVFLIDLSGSIHDTTHNPVPTPQNPPGTQSLYAYKLRDGIDCSGTILPIPDGDILDLAAMGFSAVENPRAIYAALEPLNPTPGQPQANNPTKHYQNDFKCFDIDTDMDGSADESYAIDVVTPPQPLVDVLTGIKKALQEFRDRSVAGDRVMVLGFDDEVLPIRSTYGAGNLPVMVPPTQGSITSYQFQRMLNAVTDPKGTPVKPPTHIHSFFFPRQWGKYGPGSPHLSSFDVSLGINGEATSESAEIESIWGISAQNPLPPIPAQSNLFIPLRTARDALKAESNWRSSDNFIVAFSDGKANCSMVPYIRAFGLDHYCSSTHINYYYGGINSAHAIVGQKSGGEWNIAGSNIALHFALSGKSSEPHTLLRPGILKYFGAQLKPNGCLTDAQSRLLPGQMGTHVLTGYNNFPTSFSAPNSFYSDVVETGGLWVPLRPPCRKYTPPPSNPDLTVGGTAWELFSACYNSRYVGDGISSSIDLSNIFDPDEYSQNTTDVNGDGTIHGKETRVFCDVEGKDVATQISDMFTQIMNSNPYIIVE